MLLHVTCWSRRQTDIAVFENSLDGKLYQSLLSGRKKVDMLTNVYRNSEYKPKDEYFGQESRSTLSDYDWTMRVPRRINEILKDLED